MLLAGAHNGKAASFDTPLTSIDVDARFPRNNEIDFVVSLVFMDADTAARRNDRVIDEVDWCFKIGARQEPTEFNRTGSTVVALDFPGNNLFKTYETLHTSSLHMNGAVMAAYIKR